MRHISSMGQTHPLHTYRPGFPACGGHCVLTKKCEKQVNVSSERPYISSTAHNTYSEHSQLLYHKEASECKAEWWLSPTRAPGPRDNTLVTLTTGLKTSVILDGMLFLLIDCVLFENERFPTYYGLAKKSVRVFPYGKPERTHWPNPILKFSSQHHLKSLPHIISI